MFKKSNLKIIFLLLFLIQSCGAPKKDKSTSLEPGPKKDLSENSVDEEVEVEAAAVVFEKLGTELKQLYQLPAYAVILVPKGDVQESIERLLAGGAKLLYDPNNRASSTISFYIAELTPDQINDREFIGSLKIKAASIDTGKAFAKPIETPNLMNGLAIKNKFPAGNFSKGKLAKSISPKKDFSKFIPTDSVKLGDLGEHQDLGKDIVVAVLDTGVDASHPALSDRIVYWYDGTEQTKTELKKIDVSEDSIQIEEDGKSKKILLPKNLKGATEIYTATIDESKLLGQLDEATRSEKGFLDINQNGSADKFIVFVKKDESSSEIYIDLNGDEKFLTIEENTAKIDFNTTTKENKKSGLIRFPSRNNIVAFPVLLSEEGDQSFIEIGLTHGSHGTHVAGIMAANDPTNGLLGGAPQAKIMSLRACASSGCSESAILKGLVKAFYNGKYIPDVLNMSLGSLETESREVISLFISDLAAKFGTAFFISASNSGPGFKTLNHFGNTGPAILVGANVSKKTYQDQYNLPDSSEMFDETLLFFSSLGPSYTGEMKPNIVAPGAAVSSVPSSSEYLSQMNGTSMSSPLAAGAFAAVLGNIKAKEPSLFIEIEKIRKLNAEGQSVAAGTLLPYAYAMRDALQNGAIELEDLTTAQQGYGLIQVGTTETLLTQYLKELNTATRDYFEVVINDYKPAYSRSVSTKKVQEFNLSVGFDGERSKESLAKILAGEVKVVLKQVEVINNEGKVKRYTDIEKTDYFYILERANESFKATTAKVVFNNSRNMGFVSRRDFSKMNDGNTYIAQYQVLYNGNIMTNILDVVHRPYTLKEQLVSVPNIDPNLEKIQSGFSKTGLEVETSQSHRYAFAVTQEMNYIEATVAIDQNDTGVIYLQVYKPDGTSAELDAAIRADRFDNKLAHIVIPTGLGKENTSSDNKVGIWELTISAGSSNGAKKTKYDLLIQSHGFGTSQSDFLIKNQDVTFIPIQLGQSSIGSVEKVILTEVSTFDIETKSGHTSFHPLPLAKDFVGPFIIGKSAMNLDAFEYTWISIEKQHFFIKKDGEFVPYIGIQGGNGGVYVLGAPAEETIYFSIFTNRNFGSEETGLAADLKSSVSFDIQTPVLDPSLVEQIKVSYEEHPNMKIGLIKIDAREFKGSKHNLHLVIRSADKKYSQELNLLFRE